MKRLLVVIGAALLSLPALADPAKFSVEFDQPAERKVYLQSADQLQTVPSDASVSTGIAIDKQTSVDPAKEGANVLVVVVDSKSGDVATKPLPQVLKDGKWKVADSDYKYVYEVDVLAQAKGGPVAAGVVHAETSAGKTDVALAPSDKGIAVFHMVPPGDFKVGFDYKSAGAQKSLPTQTFAAKLQAGKPQQFVLDVTDPVDVVTPVVAPATTPTAPAKPAKTDDGEEPDKAAEKSTKSAGGVLGAIASIISTLFGLIVVALVAFGLWWYIKNNQKQVQTALNQVGVPTGVEPPDPTGAMPNVPTAPQPMQKIVLDPSASQIPVGVSPSVGGPVSLASPISAQPRLVGEDGTSINLGEGPNVVGREPGLAISIVGESSVSRNHASVTVQGGTVTLVDNGSTNGTYVNGSKIASPVTLQPGDTVQFGARRFRYES